MAIYFKCPHCGNGSVDEQGETTVDYDNGLFKCTECGNLLSVEEDLISYDEYLKIWKQQESKNMRFNMMKQEHTCQTCTNSKGCVTCENGELWEGNAVDEVLENEIKSYIPRDKCPVPDFMEAVARHFYELGKKSKEE